GTALAHPQTLASGLVVGFSVSLLLLASEFHPAEAGEHRLRALELAVCGGAISRAVLSTEKSKRQGYFALQAEPLKLDLLVGLHVLLGDPTHVGRQEERAVGALQLLHISQGGTVAHARAAFLESLWQVRQGLCF